MKRFARLSLSAPPGGCLFISALIHNLMNNHPACRILLHRPPVTAKGTKSSLGLLRNATLTPLTTNGESPLALVYILMSPIILACHIMHV